MDGTPSPAWRCPVCGDAVTVLVAVDRSARTPEQAERDTRLLRESLRCSCGLAQRVSARP